MNLSEILKTTTPIMCIYHKNCLDGFGAALVVYLWAKSHHKTVTFHAAIYGDEPPKVIGKNVFIVDFSYPRDTLLEMQQGANSIIVIDHHKTAQEDLKGLDFCIFDMKKSGAVLTWEYLYPDIEIPLLFQYIQDRDLWNWQLENSREINAALKTRELDFEEWTPLLQNKALLNLAFTGSAICYYQEHLVKKIANQDIPLEDIAGYLVPCINTTHLISEIGHEISKGFPFAAMYFETASDRIYSLRSDDKGIDVSAIAKLFGGGGHYHAAGFKAPRPMISITLAENRYKPC